MAEGVRNKEGTVISPKAAARAEDPQDAISLNDGEWHGVVLPANTCEIHFSGFGDDFYCVITDDDKDPPELGNRYVEEIDHKKELAVESGYFYVKRIASTNVTVTWTVMTY